MPQLNLNKKFSRREFLYMLEGLAGLAIAGWMITPEKISTPPLDQTPKDYPELLDALQIKTTADGAEVMDVSDAANPALVCKVNTTGTLILNALDGKHSLADIISKTAAGSGREIAHPEIFASRVATFIADLGQAGLLKYPFYVSVIENKVVS